MGSEGERASFGSETSSTALASVNLPREDVRAWLADMGGLGNATCDLEDNEATLAVLSQLIVASRAATSRAKLVHETAALDDMYDRPESDRLKELLEAVGIREADLDAETQRSLDELAAVADTMSLSDVSPANLTGGLFAFKDKVADADETMLVEEMRVARLRTKAEAARRRFAELERLRTKVVGEEEAGAQARCNRVADQVDFQAAIDADRAASGGGLQSRRPQDETDVCPPGSSHRHALDRKAEADALQEEILELERLLDRFKGLPVDMVLAQRKVEETEDRSFELEEQIQRQVDGIVQVVV